MVSLASLLFIGLGQAQEVPQQEMASFVYPPHNTVQLTLHDARPETYKAIVLLGEETKGAMRYKKAREILEREAMNGDGLAMSVLGIMQINGQGFTQDIVAGTARLEEGAKAGWHDAWHYLLRIYCMWDEARDAEKAFHYATLASMYDEGKSMAQLASFWIQKFAEDSTSEQMFKEAMRCARAVAETDKERGLAMVASLYLAGVDLLGVEEAEKGVRELLPQTDEAAGWLIELLDSQKRYEECEKLALEVWKKSQLPFACYTLAVLYMRDLSPEQNYKKGLEMMQAGAETGQAQFLWGMFNYYDNPPKHFPSIPNAEAEYQEARKWLRLLTSSEQASADRARAMVAMADYYAMGKGCERDYHTAIMLLNKAESMGAGRWVQVILNNMQGRASFGDMHADEFLRLYASMQ